METDIALPPGATTSPDVRDRLRIGPTPAWVKPCAYDIEFKAASPSHLTHLLLARQVHAETRQTYVHTAMRLETMQAVQHHSQWQLQFEPRTQLVTLHWIRVHRGTETRDCANIDNIRLLQREAGLERFMVQGWFTILLLLEDVRPGDVVETGYTIESQPEMLPGHCTHVFSLPIGVAVGQFQFAVHYKPGRLLKWKSSAADLAPVEEGENGEAIWSWQRGNYKVAEAEPNTPADWIAFPWIQVSDCGDWGIVADAAAKAWRDDRTGPAVQKLMDEISRGETDLLARASKAIQMVQDDFRYLNVDLDHGGHVPSPPETVAQRRYGDCKDLSLLLVRLLKNLEIPARPILVNNRLGRSVGAMLPMPELFNHAIVEFTLHDTVCWVDPVLKLQGGDALNRFVPDYGAGLPVDSAATALSEPPGGGSKAAGYELTETILLDSTGALSPLAVLVRATGLQADSMRNQLAAMGKIEMGKQRLQHYTQRFFKATRTRETEVRDDRLKNEFIMAEAFEIHGFTGQTDSKKRLVFAFGGNLVVAQLALPDIAPRQAPFAFPFPCDLVHVIHAESSTLRRVDYDREEVKSPFFQYKQTTESRWGRWSLSMKFSALAPSIPADRMEEHRTNVAKIRQVSSRTLLIPPGSQHSVKKGDFGGLPALARKSSNPLSPDLSAPPGVEEPASTEASPADAGPGDLAEQATGLSQQEVGSDPSSDLTSYYEETSERRRQRRRQRKRNRKLTRVAVAVALVLGLITLIVLIVTH